MVNDEYPTMLRRVGLRVTAPRLAALAAIHDLPHSDADQVAGAVRERLGTVSKQAVYDVLAALTDHGLVRRVAADGHRARYELQTLDNHHHMVCRSCGALEDVPCQVGEAPCLEPSIDHGYDLEVAEVLYLGLCPSCRAAAVRV
ncbi:Fur family transcriptional regulator [Propionibacteriaceae bacterium G1746]|uniref:Fur family transcriptional regulator n=1 Tax=Aestuariimicrobium sp. G57 TaxID=3418485 RepID=UPI003C1B18DF